MKMTHIIFGAFFASWSGWFISLEPHYTDWGGAVRAFCVLVFLICLFVPGRD